MVAHSPQLTRIQKRLAALKVALNIQLENIKALEAFAEQLTESTPKSPTTRTSSPSLSFRTGRYPKRRRVGKR